MFSCTLVLLVTGLTCVWTQTPSEEKRSVTKVLTAGNHGKQGKINILSVSVLILFFSVPISFFKKITCHHSNTFNKIFLRVHLDQIFEEAFDLYCFFSTV